METPILAKRQFNRFRKVLPTPKSRQIIDDRLVISGFIFVLKNGITWGHLPEIYGNWQAVYSRFRRWCRQAILQKIFALFSSKLKKRCFAMIDSTYIKAIEPRAAWEVTGSPACLAEVEVE